MYNTNRGRGLELFSEEGYAAVRRVFDDSPEVEEEQHVRQAKAALLKADGRLNDWEVNFLSSMLFIKFPSPKQLDCLDILVAKASMRAKPRRAQKQGRRAGR